MNTIPPTSQTRWSSNLLSIHGDSSVKIYDNRIEFFNPGNLPESITEENLIAGDYVSNSRNKLIAKIFKNINWIEKYGSGIKRIIKLFADYGSPAPVFENFQHGFRVTVFSINFINDLENDLSDNQRKILEELCKNASFTQKELAEIIGISEKNIRTNMKRLKEMGLIKREGGDKVGYWKVLRNV